MSLGINALRRQILVPTTNPVLFTFTGRRSPAAASRLLSSSPSTSSQVATQKVEHARPPLARGSGGRQLGDALREVDRSEAELIATLDEYEQSAGKQGNMSTTRLSATLDEGYPLKQISQIKQYRTYEDSDSPLVAPFRRYPTRNETAASAQRHRKHLYSHLWGESNYFNADWEVAYKNLSNMTPYPTEWHSRAIQIYLTPAQLMTMSTQDPGNCIWEIGQRTGAYLQVEKYVDPQDGEQSCLILSGQEQHLRKCLNELIELLGELRAKKLPPTATPVNPPRQQQYPTERLRMSRGYLKQKTGRTIHDFFTPPQWTRASVEKYVGWLISSEPNIEAEAEYVRRRELHEHSTVVRLMTFLASSGPASAPQEALTTSAYKLALSFIGRKGSIYLREVWSLFQAMPSRRVPYDTEVFNIMFEHCAKCGNVMRFNKTLIMMHRLGFEPDFLTWQMFLRMIKDPVIKRKIVHDIRIRGLLQSPYDKENVSMEMVQHDLEHFIRSHEHISHFNIEEFIAQQDAEYGDHKWLGLNTFKRMVDTLARFGLFRDCFRSILYLARKSSTLRPNVDSFNHILVHIYRQPTKKNFTFPKLAIKTIRAMEEVRKSYEAEAKHAGKAHLYKPNAKTFHLLFHMAYRLQLPNFMAVVWRYAAMNDQTTNWMRLKVTRYLVFGRLGKSKTAPVLLRSYIRRLFMDEILMRSLDVTLMKYLQMKRRQEILQLSRLRGEAVIKHIDVAKQEGHTAFERPDEKAMEAPIATNPDSGAPPPAAPQPVKSPPGPYPAQAPISTDNYDVPAGVDPPEAWHTNASELSMLALWRSEAHPKRSFDYDVWYRHGVAVAREYRKEFRDWKPKWDLSEALTVALSRDFRLRDCVARWEAIEQNIRHGKQRNGVSHGVWLKTTGRRLIPNPIRIPIFTKLHYGNRWRSFGGDSNDVILLHCGPGAETKRKEAGEQVRKARKKMRPYVDSAEFARLFSHVKNPEVKELGGWENLLLEEGHNVG